MATTTMANTTAMMGMRLVRNRTVTVENILRKDKVSGYSTHREVLQHEDDVTLDFQRALGL